MIIRDDETALKEVKAAKQDAQAIHDEVYTLQQKLSGLERYFRVSAEDYKDFGNASRTKRSCETLRSANNLLEIVRKALRQIGDFQYPDIDLDAEAPAEESSNNKVNKNPRFGSSLELRAEEFDTDEDDE